MRSLFLLLCLSASCLAGDPIHEDFSAAGLPKGWTTGGRANSWTVADGVLQGVCSKDDGHGPAVFVPLNDHNLKASYKVKLDVKGNCLTLIDGESVFGGSAHLLRVAFYGNNLIIAQDRGSQKSHLDQAAAGAAAKKAGKTLPAPTAEQLADPEFYRTERLASVPLEVKTDDWIKVDVTMKGNDVEVTLNGTQTVKAKGTVFDVAKTRLVFLIGQGKKVAIDDVQVSPL